MNNFLDVVGALMYIAFNIILFPLFLLINCLLWSVVAARYIKAYSLSLRKARSGNKRPSYHFPVAIQLHFRKLVG